MPYSLPATGRPGHRRSFSTEAGPGAFQSLGALPRRTPPSSAKFHLKEDEDSSGSEDDQDLQHNSHVPPPLKLRVPFPQSSPLSPVDPTPPPVRPTPNRTSSTPILLSNGKPLKSSLKSSSSAPSIYNGHAHLRARSEPATPNLEMLTPTTPKNVHFPQSSSDLESVKVFNRSAKPASLLSVRGDETETETEGESSASTSTGWTLGGFISSSTSRGFPFPRMASPLARTNEEEHQYALEVSEQVPIRNPDPHANVYLESLSLSANGEPSNAQVAPMGPSLFLHGTLLLRNLAYEKYASVRFTLDNWDTTSEVIAKYSESLPSPPPFLLPKTLGDLLLLDIPTSFDRFSFTIRLSDYLPHVSHPKQSDIPLLKKRLILAIRYTVPAQGEWWDNCQGRNWSVSFRLERKQHQAESRERSLSAPAAIDGHAPTFLMPSWNPLHPTAPTHNLSPNTTPPASAPAIHERGFSEPLPSTSPQHKAVENATNARLSRFRLMNYAAPKPRSPPKTTPTAESGEDGSTPTQTPKEQVPFPTKDKAEGFPFPTPPSTNKTLEGLFWAWGQSSTPLSSVSESPQDMSRSPSPPDTTKKLNLDVPPLERSRSSSTSSEESIDFPESPLVVRPPTPPHSETNEKTNLASDSLYQAFVKHWCFVGHDTTSHHHHGGHHRQHGEGYMGIEA